MSYHAPIYDEYASATSDSASFTDTLDAAPVTPVVTMNPSPEDMMLAMREMMQEQVAEFKQQLLQLTQERDLARDAAVAAAPRPDTHMANHSAPVSAPPVERPRPRLPDIHKFSGRREEYKSWALLARRKIEVDGDSIGTPQHQCDYLFAQLQPEAHNLVAVYYERGLSTGMTAQGFLQHLDTLFVDPNAGQRAVARLESALQRDNEPFSEYLPRFERLLYEAGMDGDVNSVIYLRKNINFELKRGLVGVNIPNTYAECVSYMYKTSSELEQLKEEMRIARKPQAGSSTRTYPPKTYPTTPVRNPDAMDWAPTTVGMSALKSLTDREREHLRKNNGCFRCRKTNAGHLARDCPNSRVPTRAAAIPSQRPEVGGLTDEQLSENGEL